jgi:plasmid stabilization system protein ParE
VKLDYAIEAIQHLEESLDVTCAGMSVEKRESLVTKIFKETERLMKYPRAGQIEPLMEGMKFEYRRLVVGNFKVIYRIDGEWIRITDFFDARRDPRSMRG